MKKRFLVTFCLFVLSIGVKAQVLSSYAHSAISNSHITSEYSRIGDSIFYHVRVVPNGNYLYDPNGSDNWVAFQIFYKNSQLAGSLYIDFDESSFPSVSGTDYYGVVDVSGVDLSQCEILTGWSSLYEDPNSTSVYPLNPDIHWNILTATVVTGVD